MATSPEQLLISSVLRESAFALAVQQGIDQKHFTSRLAEWTFLEDYYAKYRRTPSRQVFKASFPDFAIKPVTDVEYYADELKRHYTRRLLTASMKDVADFITDGDITTAIDRMREGVLMVATEAMPGDDGDIFSKHDDVLEEIIERKKRFDATGTSGVPTGIALIDEHTGGMGPSEHWIVAARQGAGKSWLLQSISARATMAGYNAYFAALEQTRAQVSMRIYSMMSNSIGKDVFRSEDLMRGKNYDIAKFTAFMREMKSEQQKRGFGQLVVADSMNSKISPLSLQAQIDKYDPDVVFIDYIQLMNQNRGMGPAGLAQVTEEITAITNQKAIPIVSASQLNRDSVTSGTVGTENLSGSDQLGNDATVVLVLKQLSPSVAYLKNVKSRYGVTGWGSHLEFRPDEGVCDAISEERALDLIDDDAYKSKLRASASQKAPAIKANPNPDTHRKRRLNRMIQNPMVGA